MRLKLILPVLRGGAILALVAALLFGIHLVHCLTQGERAGEANSDRGDTHQRARDGFVMIEEEAAERYGIEVTAAKSVQWYERVTVYGRVVPNPRAMIEVRAPFAGALRAADVPWPAPGQWVEAGQLLGWLDVRVGPEVRTDLEHKLAEARIKKQGAEEEVRLQESRVKSLRDVTSQSILPRAELDAALVQLAQARTQRATATAAAELWQKALAEIRGRAGKLSPWSEPVKAPAAGEVAELAVRPGMMLEAGNLIVQLVDVRRPLVRLELPPEILSAGLPSRMELHATSATPSLHGILKSSLPPTLLKSVEATLLGPAPRLDVASQFVGYWYEVLEFPAHPKAMSNRPGAVKKTPQGILWRPGLQVRASLRSPGTDPRPAVAVLADAVLYHEGRPLVYVRITPEKYQRRQVELLGRKGDLWVVLPRQAGLPVGVAPGEFVVSRQAQILLSEEFHGAAVDDD
jgi:biotin carboxyl carrier protein